MPVFSRAALISLGVLVVTGVYQGWRESGATDALTTTTYGRLVLVKATLFLVLVSLGYASRGMVSRRLITAAAGNEGPSSNALISTPRLRQTVLLEAALGVVVLAVPAVLVARPPGRAAASASATSAGTGPAPDLGSSRSITVTVDPARSGATTVTTEVTGARPQQLVLTATLPTKDIGPLTVGLRRQPDGRYRAEDVLLPNPGRWMFTAVVRRQSSTLSPRPCPIQVD